MATALPYESTGTATVTVGQTAVVGQGTRWTRCRPSDTFYGRSGERNIVASITDDTHLDLLFPATIAQAAQGVAVMRTPDDVFTQTMARDVFQKISDSTLVALAGLPPVAKTLLSFDANKIASTIPFTDKAKSLLNIDLSDNVMSVLSSADYASILTKLGISVFARTFLDDTDAATVRATLATNDAANLTTGTLLDARVSNTLTADKAYRRGNAVGSVQQVGGVPSGALMEFGSNASGSYARFANGVQICWINNFQTGVPNLSAAGVWQGATYTWSFAAAFAGPPAVACNANHSGNWATIALTSTNTATVTQWSYIQRPGTYETVTAMAIGVWY